MFGLSVHVEPVGHAAFVQDQRQTMRNELAMRFIKPEVDLHETATHLLVNGSSCSPAPQVGVEHVNWELIYQSLVSSR